MPVADNTIDSPERRRQAADALLALLQPHYDEFGGHEQRFWNEMQERSECSRGQLTRVQEMRDRYC